VAGLALRSSNLRLQQDLIEELLDAGPLLRTDLGMQDVAAELLEQHAVLQEVLLHLGHVRCGEVHLVDRHDHRHAGVLGVADRLDRLRHHLVVGGDDQDHDVGDLRPAGAHGREGLVARRIEERHGLAVGQLDVVGPDVLGDPARLTRDDVRLADIVEQRGLAVVNVAHDRDHRRPRYQIRLGISDGLRLGLVLVLPGRLEAELRRDELDLVEVETLVHRHHQPSSLNANWTIWVAGIFMLSASSETEMNSLTRIRVFSRSFSSA
jgi:hypothetical protein